MLENLNQLALEAKEKCENYDKGEFVFSDEFKNRFLELMPNYNIDFQNYTSIVTTSQNLSIILPNQWFILGSFFNYFISALKIYKQKVNDAGISHAEVKQIRETNNITQEIQNKIKNIFDSGEDIIFFERFLKDYDWWYGSKTIDRNDYFVSAVLNLAGVIHNSQSYISNLAYTLSENQELVEILENDFDEYQEVAGGIIVGLSPLVEPQNKIYYGSPGTGKSHKVNERLKDLNKIFYERITFHPEYDHASFVGGYKPISEINNEGIDEVKYKFVPQVFTEIYKRAWKDLDNQYYLAIEEINRGNCAEIFGDIFQLLDRKSNYTVTPSTELKRHLEEELGTQHDGIIDGLKLPSNLTIYATMNTSDQSLFPMDSAFKRRWNWEYIPINYDETDENLSSKYFVEIEEGISFSWIKFIEAVNTKIKHNQNLGMDKCIGNYFIKPENEKIELKEFINKAIFYLWNDVFKDEDERDSIFRKDVFYENFFPVDSYGKELVLEIMNTDDFMGVLNTEPEV